MVGSVDIFFRTNGRGQQPWPYLLPPSSASHPMSAESSCLIHVSARKDWIGPAWVRTPTLVQSALARLLGLPDGWA